MNKKLTLITHHYNGHSTLKKLVDSLESYSDFLLSNIALIAIDDFSDEEIPISSSKLDFIYYRITDDIQWNQAGARNLGVSMAKSEWSLLFDIDQMPFEDELTRLVENLSSFNRKSMYYFRVDDFIDSNLNKQLEIHPNTMLVANQEFKSMGMYDEDFAGHYGYEDLYLPYVWEKNGGTRCILGEKSLFKDQKIKTEKLSRDGSINKALAEAKIQQGIPRPKGILRFNWKILFAADI